MSDTVMGLDVADTLCYQLGDYAIGRYLAAFLAKDRHLRRHAEGRKSGARLSGGHFIVYLAAHFGLVRDEELRSLSMITRELPMIDLHKLVRLNICMRLGDTWAWVSLGPDRQSNATVGAPEAARDALAVDEEDVHELRQSIVGLRRDVDRLITDQGRFATWIVSCMTQLMDASGHTYQAFNNTLVGDLLTYLYHDVMIRLCMMKISLADAIRCITGFGIWHIDYLYRPCCKEID
nr:hypothetical protein [Tanacetum cinerariifolium]